MAIAASLVLLAASSTVLAPPASAAAASVTTKVPLQPTISFPNGNSALEGGQLAVRFDANGDPKVTSFRYSFYNTSLGSEVLAGPDGTATVTIDVGSGGGQRPVYAVAIDRHGQRSPMTQATFTVSVIWDLRGQALDMTTWLPVAGATIRLEPAGVEVVTGPDGYFQFDVDPGLYTLTGTYAGPPSLSGSSHEMEIDGQGLWFELYLFPDPAS
ncbi:hypothetical protein [Micromonospora sp. NPDC047074]|uniref:hypothetical protein n=1 Tax=Micromonospora sp. NPDC047074 TaxID=3154339 RepID=UPI0033F7B9AE